MSAMILLGPTPASAEGVAKELIQPVTGLCGVPTGNPATGTVELHRVSNTVDLVVHLDGARPDTVYDITLIRPPPKPPLHDIRR
jgi:hypothetical protein